MTWPQATTVPAVMSALFTLADAIANAKALDGPVRQWPKSDAIVVGYGRNGAVNHRARQQGLGAAYLETYDVACAIHSQVENVDTGFSARRARCGDMLSQFKAALFANHTLSGACMKATIGDSLQWFQTLPGGASCDVEFTVHVEATI